MSSHAPSWDAAGILSGISARLRSGSPSFSGAYLDLGAMGDLIRGNPDLATPDAVAALSAVLDNRRYSRRRQAYFLFRAAGELLAWIRHHGKGEGLRRAIDPVLDRALQAGGGPAHRAAAEAVGGLPLTLATVGLGDATPAERGAPAVRWAALVAEADPPSESAPEILGRSIRLRCRNRSEILVVKMARREECGRDLVQECRWACLLHANRQRFPERFEIPDPLAFHGSHLFRLIDPPQHAASSGAWHPRRYAVAFRVHGDYFVYPTDHRPGRGLSPERFLEVLERSASLFGRLAAMGIAHTAPIPLFHNRVQRQRRTDRGLYEWQRGGRLDQWLRSCRYPNFGLSGLRDLEHLHPIRAGTGSGLYAQVGNQILSLVLVAGSYFRNKAPERMGRGADGAPLDTRDLFDPGLLGDGLRRIVRGYLLGFVGEPWTGPIPVTDHLVDRLIEGFGVDTHMEEVLRVADQEAMSQAQFEYFLASRGVSGRRIAGLVKGAGEITLDTGPHLGGFNQRISVPELISFLETVSAICVLHKYRHPAAV